MLGMYLEIRPEKKNGELVDNHGNSITGTHDIQNVTVTSSPIGHIRVTGDFVDGSTATGALLIIYSLDNDSDVHYNTIAKQAEDNIRIDMMLTGPAGSQYGVSIFALENGLPFPRVVTLPKNATVVNSNHRGLINVHDLLRVSYS